MPMRRDFLTSAAATVVATTVPVVLRPKNAGSTHTLPPKGIASTDTPSPDAALLALGAEFDRAEAVEAAAWARYEACSDEEDEAFNDAAVALNEITGKIVDRIEACRATTVPGVMVKVRALKWCTMEGKVDYETFGYGWPVPLSGTPSTDVRLLTAITNEMIALSGAEATS